MVTQVVQQTSNRTEGRHARSQLWMMMCRQSSGIGWCMAVAEVAHPSVPWVGVSGDELLGDATGVLYLGVDGA